MGPVFESLRHIPWIAVVLLKEAEIIPFPNEDVTPPVTNMYFVVLKMNKIKRFVIG